MLLELCCYVELFVSPFCVSWCCLLVCVVVLFIFSRLTCFDVVCLCLKSCFLTLPHPPIHVFWCCCCLCFDFRFFFASRFICLNVVSSFVLFNVFSPSYACWRCFCCCCFVVSLSPLVYVFWCCWFLMFIMNCFTPLFLFWCCLFACALLLNVVPVFCVLVLFVFVCLNCASPCLCDLMLFLSWIVFPVLFAWCCVWCSPLVVCVLLLLVVCFYFDPPRFIRLDVVCFLCFHCWVFPRLAWFEVVCLFFVLGGCLCFFPARFMRFDVVGFLFLIWIVSPRFISFDVVYLFWCCLDFMFSLFCLFPCFVCVLMVLVCLFYFDLFPVVFVLRLVVCLRYVRKIVFPVLHVLMLFVELFLPFVFCDLMLFVLSFLYFDLLSPFYLFWWCLCVCVFFF